MKTWKNYEKIKDDFLDCCSEILELDKYKGMQLYESIKQFSEVNENRYDILKSRNVIKLKIEKFQGVSNFILYFQYEAIAYAPNLAAFLIGSIIVSKFRYIVKKNYGVEMFSSEKHFEKFQKFQEISNTNELATMPIRTLEFAYTIMFD